jgi:hypothetical protein
MKYLTVSILMLAILTLNTQPTAANNNPTAAIDKKQVQHEKGEKVGARVRQLRKHNKNVDRALAAFERNGKKPRIDESESFTVEADDAGGTAALKESPFRNVSYKPHFLPYIIQTIVIPTYEAPGEWQGTVIYNKFATSGAYLGEYVADVIIGPDPTYTLPDVKLEVSYEEGQAYLEYGNENVYQQLGTPGLGFLASKQGGVTFSKARFQGGIIAREIFRRVIQSPRVRSYVKCVWMGSASGALGCGAISAFFGGAPFIPCLLGAGTAANSLCVMITVFGP